MSENTTSADAESLARKLAQFDAELTVGEREIFRSRVLEAVLGEAEVEGYAMEMRWGSDANGIFFRWVSIDGDGEVGELSAVDPSRWTTLSREAGGAAQSRVTSSAEGTTDA